MNIDLDGGGKFIFEAPQQRWNSGPRSENKGVLEVAYFAGQELMAIADDAGGFRLRYLNFTTGDFKTMESAKLAAAEFARHVLARMTAMLSD
ncbi:hypothetical protein AB7849_09360 [Rhodanobacter sp. 115]|uniref:hypothetical protein n=1 Tax=Rhodanobacter sp. FW021-MT20 TaxID=1162282 RepID=UPI0034E4769D